jgi:formate--tetrahydrofolate ligase
VWAKGGESGVDLAETVLYAIENAENHFAPLYNVTEPIPEKIRKIAQCSRTILKERWDV